MRLTLRKKLVAAFLFLSLLVFLAGAVGIAVLKKVSQSADSVAKEKSPVQYAVMNSALNLEMTKRLIAQYTSANTGLQQLEEQIATTLQRFDSWMDGLRYGSDSEEFRRRHPGQGDSGGSSTFTIPKASPQMLTVLEKIESERTAFETILKDLFESYRTKLQYDIHYNTKFYSLPNYLNLAQNEHLEWLKSLKDAVNIETDFTGNTDPDKGTVGGWLATYKVPDKEMMTLLGKLRKQYTKLLKLAQKINQQNEFKKKQRLFNRGIGTTARIDKYFLAIRDRSAVVYSQLNSRTTAASEKLNSSISTINTHLDNLIKIAAMEMEQALGQAEQARYRGTTTLIVLTVLAVVLAILLGTFLSRSISTRVAFIARATKNIADGDLTTDLQAKANDELGDLARDSNSMVTHLRAMIGKISNYAQNLSGAASDLTSVSEHLDGNANRLNERSTAATEATSTMNSSMLEISSLANDSMERVQNVAMATEEMASTISEIAKNTEQASSVTRTAVDTVELTTQKMNDLSEAATEIGKVAEVIVNIAEQTNLLSLNATIEAARAGEAGKGFAVVANEVKELAKQTNDATVDIRQKIIAIQQSSDMTIREITEITDIINKINSIVVMIAGAVEEQAATTSQITEDINSVAQGIEGVNEHVDAATRVSETVSSDIGEVNAISEELAEGSGSIKNNSQALGRLANELNQLVSQFKL